MQELEYSISKQKTEAKSTDLDTIHPRILSHFPYSTKKLLLWIYNYSIQKGRWIWDTSEVIFIRKPDKSSYASAGAYRPLTLASCIGKIFERILDQRMREHIDATFALDDDQEGFCTGRSTVRYLFRMVSNLTEIKRQKLNCIILFIDFEKAFDSVYIPLLIVKLKKFGIDGPILKLINTFLTKRNVKLNVNKNVGHKRKCSLYGLPQG